MEPFDCTWFGGPVLSFPPAVLHHYLKRQLAVVTVDSDIAEVL